MSNTARLTVSMLVSWGALFPDARAEPAEAQDPAAEVAATVADLGVGLSLTETELASLQSALASFAELGGALGHARNMVWVATVRGCRGPCLSAVADALVIGASAGLPDATAAELALRSLGAPQPADLEAWARAVRGEVALALASTTRVVRCASEHR